MAATVPASAGKKNQRRQGTNATRNPTQFNIAQICVPVRKAGLSGEAAEEDEEYEEDDPGTSASQPVRFSGNIFPPLNIFILGAQKKRENYGREEHKPEEASFESRRRGKGE